MKRIIFSLLALLVFSGVIFSQTPVNVEKASRFQSIQQNVIPENDGSAASSNQMRIEAELYVNKSSAQLEELGVRYAFTRSNSQLEELGSRYVFGRSNSQLEELGVRYGFVREPGSNSQLEELGSRYAFARSNSQLEELGSRYSFIKRAGPRFQN